MDNNTNLPLALTLNEINYINQVLANQPFKDVNNLLVKLNKQANDYINAVDKVKEPKLESESELAPNLRDFPEDS